MVCYKTGQLVCDGDVEASYCKQTMCLVTITDDAVSVFWLMLGFLLVFWKLPRLLSASAEETFGRIFMLTVILVTMVYMAWIIHDLSWKYGPQGPILFLPGLGCSLGWARRHIRFGAIWRSMKGRSFRKLRARWSYTERGVINSQPPSSMELDRMV